MTNEEREIIAGFVARVSGAPPALQGAPQPAFAGTSVPATTAPALPPVDREADAFIADQFTRYPDARYRITQLAFVQEHALVEAQNRIRRLEWELQQAQAMVTQPQPQQSSGFFSGLFGGRGASAPPQQGPAPVWGQGGPAPGYAPSYQSAYAPPAPQYPPGYNPGVFQGRGSGFLGSALTTAAGVAGGMLAADAIRSMFSPHTGMGLGGGFAPGMGSPWGAGATPSTEPGSIDQGSWTPTPDAAPDPGYVDSGTWDQPTDPGGDARSWDDASDGGTDDDSL